MVKLNNGIVSCLVKASPPELLIEKFNLALTQYTAALHCIVPVFIYMVKNSKTNASVTEYLQCTCSDKSQSCVFDYNCYHDTLHLSAFEPDFVKEQVLH